MKKLEHVKQINFQYNFFYLRRYDPFGNVRRQVGSDEIVARRRRRVLQPEEDEEEENDDEDANDYKHTN